jgi:CubicO group peptidase (beta-lactamase class C family)
LKFRLLILLTFMAHSLLAADLDKTIVKGDTGAKIDDFMTRLERLGYSGAVLVAKNGEVVIHKAYGWRDAAAKLPYTIDTASTVGSITKQFTAAGILALEEEGKLSTTDLITKYFPNVPDDKKTITIHQLLTHSAGFPDAIGDDYETTGREEFIKRAMGTKLLFTPGSGYRYTNVGYSLLGAIIEQVTGGSYERYLHDRLFVRAGMEHTGYVIPKWDRAKLAHGVEDGQPWGTNLDRPWAPDGPYWHLRANGGILSTPADMYRWSLALDGDKVLSAASRKKLFTPYVKEGDSPSYYAYGWAIFTLPNGHKLIAHNGGNGIFAADFRRYIDDGVVLFITSNVNDKPSTASSRFVGRIAIGMELPMPPKVIMLTTEQLHKVEGTYDGVKVAATSDGAITLTPVDAAALARLAPPLDGPRAAVAEKVTQRTQAIAAAMLKNDYRAIQSAFDNAPPLEEIERRQNEMRHDWEAKFGAIKGASVAATYAQRDLIATLIRFEFEHGNAYLRLVWEGPNALVGVRPLDQLPSTTYMPLSPAEFATYDFQSGETKTVRFVDGKLVL